LFFRKKGYDYKELAKKFSCIIHKNLSLDELNLNLLKFLADTVHTEGAALVLKEKETYSVRQCLGWRSFAFRTEDFKDLIQWFNKHRQVLTRSQILEDVHFSYIKRSALPFFVQFQAEICVPLFVQEDLLGFVTLSVKKNGKPYTTACQLVLDWLGAQIALFLKNAMLREEILLQKMELETVKDLKSQIIANLSHELRTPLTGVIGFSELLSEEMDGPLNEEQKKHVLQIQDGADRLMKTLSAFVDLAKLEAGNLPLHVQQFPLAPLVTSLGDEIPFNMDTNFKIDFEPRTPMIYGDLSLVRQIFKHLLDNAAKYTPKGEVHVSADKKGEMLEVCVADTGIGISEEKLTRIFDGLYQVDGGITREFQGPGIGLALSKKLIELHGGRLWVKSQPGRGSRFFFTLPLKPIAIRHKELAA